MNLATIKACEEDEAWQEAWGRALDRHLPLSARVAAIYDTYVRECEIDDHATPLSLEELMQR